MRLIDIVLKDVLGWPLEQIQCEEHVSGDFLDYVLGSPSKRAVVEAKRSERTFDVPAGVFSGLVALATVRDYNSKNEAAVDQVLSYCQKAGIGVAVLSNGHQFLGFLGSRSDGRKPVEGKALFYDSLDAIVEDFPRFWDSFSCDGMVRGDFTRSLQASSTSPPPPSPLSSRIHGYPGYRIGSEMETDLRILGDLFIQDVLREDTISDEFLSECYAASGALSQYAVVSKEILKSRYTVLGQQVNIEDARDRRGTNPRLKEDLLAGALVRRPIILLGDVGVGKSIFLRHLFRIDASELLDKTVVFYVDFIKHSGLIDDVPSHIVSVISGTLRDSLGLELADRAFIRSVYNQEINSFKRGIYGALEEDDAVEFRRREIEMLEKHVSNDYEHARRSLHFLQASRGLNFVLALDNVDQHLPMFQEQIFVAGQSLAETWPVAVFMSLRPDTFHTSRRSGALAAYQPRVFTVSPPRVDQVIIKRLKFARKQLVDYGRLPGFPEGLTLDSDSLLVYVDVLLSAFENNQELISLVDNLSSGNTRRALGFISTFVGSGYVQTARILEAHKRGDQYTIPVHEFIRAVLFGDHQYYDASSSPVPNMFDLSRADAKEHFLLPLMLATVERKGERGSGGFAEMPAVYGDLQGLGYTADQIDYHVNRAIERQLVEVAERGANAKVARITSAGGYLWKVLIVQFAYVDAVIVDTPILHPDTRSRIQDIHEIDDRIERAEIFIDYLTECWPYGTDDLPFSWPYFVDAWSKTLAAVRRGAARAASRREQRA